ncbi:hypothetical protein GG681_16595 [Epibacterium sp. SM1969]|uniref:Pyocin activator protein PrtN n=1 Tax=Tritonibacter aquimaris TaxID=2663379 RepID=A0A844AWK5_9RHOB|nr:pyocin activator PrtN family protein [Tritonibacter aquimaris]MQY44267.1 hypothetical protein [Tritonibacter aquimaris]
MKTIDMLLAHFGGNPIIPLEHVAQYLNYRPDTLKQKIDVGDIRLPYIGVENNSQKAQKFIQLSIATPSFQETLHAGRSSGSSMTREIVVFPAPFEPNMKFTSLRSESSAPSLS